MNRSARAALLERATEFSRLLPVTVNLHDPANLERLFGKLDDASSLIIAVSGGPDSIALMHLLACWNDRPQPRTLIAATVDHGLRPEAATEADFVARTARSIGLSHHILRWTGRKPASGLQERAREARYGLLVSLARDKGASHLVTAHTRDDQAETILMRMAKGSGVTGLCGMATERDRDGIRHIRPLLDITKAELVSICQSNGWDFVTDPSNVDDRFARVRWRRLMPLLAEEGLDSRRFAALAGRLRQAEDALDAKSVEAYGRARLLSAGEGVVLDGAVIATEPFEIALRVLRKGLAEAGLPQDQARLNRAETALGRLLGALVNRAPLRMSLAGAILDLTSIGWLTIAPEKPRKRGR